MQFHAESLRRDRPVPPPGCPGRMGTPCCGSLHLHGYYFRKGAKAVTAYFQCPRCFACFSVIPAGMLPYRSDSTTDAQRFCDQRSRLNLPDNVTKLADEDTAPFAPANPQQGHALLRLWLAFGVHAFFLAGILGIAPNSPPATVWRLLRGRWGTLTEVLLVLHAHHTSLTKSYLSLKPWWLGGLARGWRTHYATGPP